MLSLSLVPALFVLFIVYPFVSPTIIIYRPPSSTPSHAHHGPPTQKPSPVLPGASTPPSTTPPGHATQPQNHGHQPHSHGPFNFPSFSSNGNSHSHSPTLQFIPLGSLIFGGLGQQHHGPH